MEKVNIIYNVGIKAVQLGLKWAASFNQKISLGVKGRNETFEILEKSISKTDKTIWFHCASLGEFEQGLPVFAEVRTLYKTHKIVLSFFSPSGYEIRKSTPIADVVVYLPMDTKKNAERYLNLLHPELTIFVKYDIWPNFLNEIKYRKLRAILISAAFRQDQPFFKFYGKPLREALFAFEHIFTQNVNSKKLLESIQYNEVTVSGDTRFDRVFNQLQMDNHLEFIKIFKGNSLCVVAGSTWPEDEKLLIDFINSEPLEGVKFILAPHNIKSNQIEHIQEKLNAEVILFSNKDQGDLHKAKVFILDTIGILTKVYSYADIAYVGGAMGSTGLHNTLEPAVFGVPIMIGMKHSNFPEAQEMIDFGGMFSISNKKALNTILNDLIENKEKRGLAGRKNFKYIEKNRGLSFKFLII